MKLEGLPCCKMRQHISATLTPRIHNASHTALLLMQILLLDQHSLESHNRIDTHTSPYGSPLALSVASLVF